jgi:hypothetical protein
MILPTSYREIKRLAKKMEVTLTPSKTTSHFPNVCYITMLGFANKIGFIDGKPRFCYNNMDQELCKHTDHYKYLEIEDGFENGVTETKYNRIGARLRKDWEGQS